VVPVQSDAEDPRSNCVDLLDRSIAALPEGVEQIRCRWDAGYFAGQLAHACIEGGWSSRSVPNAPAR